MRFTLCVVVFLQLSAAGYVSGFTTSSFSASNARMTSHTTKPSSSFSSLAIATTTGGDESTSAEVSNAEQMKKEKRELLRREGGRFAFDTKYGALNPFAIYYGLTAIFLGIPWFIALCFCQLFYTLTGNKIDKQVRIFKGFF